MTKKPIRRQRPNAPIKYPSEELGHHGPMLEDRATRFYPRPI